MSATTVSPSHRGSIVFILVTVAIDSIGFGIVLPVLPQLIIELTGDTLSDTAYIIGWMWFAYAIMQFFCAPIVGNLSDRFGRRPILLIALAALGTDYLIMANAPTIAWLFVGRAIAGVAGSTYSTANAYVADISQEGNRAQNFGLLGASFGAGFVLGPVIGGILGEIGPRVPFYAAATLSLVNVAYGFFVVKESLSPQNRRAMNWSRANPVGALNHLWSNPVVFGLALALFLYMIGHYSLPTVWVVYVLEKFQWSEWQVGVSLFVVGTAMIIVQGLLIRSIIPAIGAARAGYLGLVVTVIGFVGYASATQGWHMYVWIIVSALAGLVMPAFQSVMTSRVPANRQGELQGAIASMNSITTVIGPLIMTRLFGYFVSGDAPFYFPGAAFIVSAMLTAFALFIFVGVIAKTSKSEKTQPVPST